MKRRHRREEEQKKEIVCCLHTKAWAWGKCTHFWKKCVYSTQFAHSPTLYTLNRFRCSQLFFSYYFLSLSLALYSSYFFLSWFTSIRFALSTAPFGEPFCLHFSSNIVLLAFKQWNQWESTQAWDEWETKKRKEEFCGCVYMQWTLCEWCLSCRLF